MNDYIKISESEFIRNADPGIAAGQKLYMKNHFEFFGIKTPLRREISKPFLQKEYLPDKNLLEETIKTLWKKPRSAQVPA